ncbi:MAG: tetratricopeptide repeat protein, partial [Pseudomonadota bacterium]
STHQISAVGQMFRILSTGSNAVDLCGESIATVAQQARSEYLIRGRYELGDSGYRLTAQVYSVGSGRQIAEHLADGTDLVSAVDDLGERISETLVGDLDRDPASYVTIALSEAATDNPEALQAYGEGIMRLVLDNDYAQSIARLEDALALDPQMAQSYYMLHSLHRLNGDLAASSESTREALRLDYKLDTEAVFVMRANGYATTGEYDKAIRVIEMWTQVHPEMELAWTNLARNYLLIGEIDNAREALLQAQAIDPDNPDIYLDLADTEALAGNFDLAIERMDAFLDQNPDNEEAWLTLGRLNFRQGQFDRAKEAFEYAGFIGSNPFAADLGLIRVESYGGDIEQAERMIERELSEYTLGTEFAQLVSEKTAILMQTGRPAQALAFLEANDDAMRQSVPPIIYDLSNVAFITSAYRMLGQYNTALELIDSRAEASQIPFNYFISLSALPILYKTGGAERARAIYDEASAYFETFDFPGRDNLLLQNEAYTLAIQGRYAEASERLEAAVTMTNTSSLGDNFALLDELRYRLAEFRLADGNIEQARDAVDELLNAHPNHSAGQLLRVEIEQAADNSQAASDALKRLLVQWSNAEQEYLNYQEALLMADAFDLTP